MEIRFEKLGHVFKPTGEFSWSQSHAQVPFPLDMGDRIRIFFATRDARSQSSVSFIDVDKQDPKKILYVHDKPCLSHGAAGTYDDSGAMPSWFMRDGENILLYYTGWNKSETASYRLSVGLASSEDEGLNFSRVFPGPVLDRGLHDPVWVGQPCVMKDGDTWKMWYLSCQKIEKIHEHPEPFYNVKYAESPDGINWNRTDDVCIGFDTNTDAIGRPFVWKRGKRYLMLHSNRRADGYRTEAAAAYRIEISESDDGIRWKKIPVTFPKSEEGWDMIMNEYASYFPVDENGGWMFYNGMGFGASGFGLARITITS